MFNSFDVLNRDMPVAVAPYSAHVNDANKYEGKDNPGVPWYYRRKNQKKEEEKKERPKSDHKVDFVA